jgi:hypothetical protein
MNSFDDSDLVVRLGCYKVGSDQQVLRERSLVSGKNLFRFRWMIAHANADQDQPAIADLYVPGKDDEFVVSFDPPLAGPVLIIPQKDHTIQTSEKIARITVVKNVAGASYALTLGTLPEGVRPKGWPTAPVEIHADASGDLKSTADGLVAALNTPDMRTGAPRPWTAFKVSDVGIEFRLRDPTQFPDAHLSQLLGEMSVDNASDPADIIAVIPNDKVFDPSQRLAPAQDRSLGEFLDGCKDVDGSAVIDRAAVKLRKLLSSIPNLDGNALHRFCEAFVRGLYVKFTREISLEDLLRDSRSGKAAAFASWFDTHIENCAADLQIRNWDDATRRDFKTALTQASRIVIREIDEAIQGKNAVALAMAMGSVTPYQTRSGVASHAALPELCGMEFEFDATPFVDGARYKRTTVTIRWNRPGHAPLQFGLYPPNGNQDCFNGAAGPATDLPKPELLEDGFFIAQPDKADKRPVFKSTSGDGLISVRITNTSPRSYWPAFFVYLSDDSAPPSLTTALASEWFSRLSAVDPARQPVEIPLPPPATSPRKMLPVHWQTMLSSDRWTPAGPGNRTAVKPKYVWLFARSVAGGWLPPIAVNRSTDSPFGLKLPPSLSGLAPNQIPRLSTGTPEAPRLKRPEIIVRTGQDGKLYLDVVVNAVASTDTDPGYYEKYGIDRLHMLVFRRPGDLPKDGISTRHSALRSRSSDVQDDFAYYQSTGWYKALLVSGWFPLPDIYVYPNPAPSASELTLSYPTVAVPGWKYLAVIVAKRSQDLCYQVPRTAQESGTVDDNSYFPAVGYVPDGVLLKADTPQAWRYLASGYDPGSVVPPQFDKAIRFEYSQPAVTVECYLPSQETDDVVNLISI